MSPRAATTASDAALIARIRLGDPTAFEQMSARHRGPLHDLATLLTASPDALVDRTLDVAHAALRRARGPRTWMRGYLLGLTLQLHQAPMTQAPVRPGRETGRHQQHPAHSIGVEGGYAALADAWQAVLWHRLVEQESCTEIAAVIGVSQEQVDALVGSARTDLQRSLLRRRWEQDLPAPCRAHTRRLMAAREGWLPRSVQRHAARCPACGTLVQDLGTLRDSLPEALADHVLAAAGERYLATRDGSGHEQKRAF